MAFRKPDFFIVGAPKCGTTWLHRYLSQHPDVFTPIAKEPHYFNTDSGWRWYPTLDAYEALFQDVPSSAKRVGEASVLYMFSDVAVPNILEYQPAAKFIAMVRNPVKMVPSMHQQLLFSQDENVTDLGKAWSMQKLRAEGSSLPPHCHDPRVLQYAESCALGKQLERLIDTAGGERVLVLVLEDVRSHPAREFRRVLDFLGLAAWEPPSFEVVNEAKARRAPLLKKATLEVARWKRALGLKWSLGVLRGINQWNVRKQPRKPVPAELREELVAHFESDIRLLERLLQRDFPHWRTAT